MTLSQIRWQSRCVLTMPSPQWFALCHHKHFKTCIVTQVLFQSARDNRAPEARATPTTPFTLNKPHVQASRVMRWEGWDGRDNLWANHTSTYGKGPQASLNLSIKLAALFPHWNVRALPVPAERLKLAYAISDILGFALNVFPFPMSFETQQVGITTSEAVKTHTHNLRAWYRSIVLSIQSSSRLCSGVQMGLQRSVMFWLRKGNDFTLKTFLTVTTATGHIPCYSHSLRKL